MPTFRSRVALWTLWLSLGVIGLTALPVLTFRLGGCSGGFETDAICTRIPDQLGQLAGELSLLGVVVCLFVALPLAVVALIGEGAARWLPRRRA